jgi:predicted PurR-regulated permease PerM
MPIVYSSAPDQVTKPPESPRWNNTAKLVAGLSILAVIGWLVLRFFDVVGVLVVAVLLAYLLHPMADRLRTWTRMSWRAAATLVFLLTLMTVIGLVTAGGFAIVEQAQGLVGFLTGTLGDLPSLMSRLPTFDFAGYHFPPASLTDLSVVGQQLLNMLQPVLTRTTSLLTAIASGAASTVGWFFFAMVVAYFMLAESGGIRGQMITLSIPGYGEDMARFGRYLSGIWNAFLRGQLTIIFITVIVYVVLLSVLGVRYVIGLALLAGLARFVPYVGAFVAWTTFGLVAFFQGFIPFGMQPLGYALLVVGLAWTTDTIMDNFVSARLMGNALKVHPAVVMVSAIIAANLIGLIGVMLAAPVVATIKLLSQYIFNKLLDRDPWEGVRTTPTPIDSSIRRALLLRLFHGWRWLTAFWRRQTHQVGS